MAKKRAINIRLRLDQLRSIAKIVAADSRKLLDRSKVISFAVDEYLSRMQGESAERETSATNHVYHGIATQDEMRRMNKGQQIQIGQKIRPAKRPPLKKSGHA